METLQLPYLNDMHVHLRDLSVAQAFAKISMEYCQHILAMPNVNPPLDTPERWSRYRQHVTIDNGLPEACILVAFKLTAKTTPEMIKELALRGGGVCKLYPDGVTTSSESGITGLKPMYPIFEAMEAAGLLLSIHGEQPGAFCLDREHVWLMEEMSDLLPAFPDLKIVLEHITTAAAVDFIETAAEKRPGRIAATITAHHLMLTLDDVIGDLLQPGFFCKPIAKRDRDRLALLEAATSREPCFFLGSDSAPHSHSAKHNCGCAGCFTAPYLPELLATIFEEYGQLDKLAGFASTIGARFYGLAPPKQLLTLHKVAAYQPTKLHDPLPDSGEFYDIFHHPKHPLTWSRASQPEII